MVKKLSLVFIFCFFLLVIGAPFSYAKKSLLRKGTTTVSGTSGVIISPRLRSDRLALNINFQGLSKAISLSYLLSYNTNGRSEVVQGTILPKGDTDERTLVFGTFSSGAWRYHTNITGMKFVVTSSLKSGMRVVKTFKVKP